MRNLQIISALLLAALAFAAGPGLAARQDVLKRYAIIVGSNNGGADRVKLRYAVSDARAVLEVLRKLGGVEKESALLLVEPRKDRLIESIAEMRGRVIGAKKTYARVELIFYYSGHSDDEGIIPGGDKIYYRDIKQAVLNIPADVRIAILDSCSSGAFTSIKGGRRRSPFLVDRSHSMKGFAFMTSSSSDEASQESDRIRGSFFTHSLLTGLRGAADQIGDGRITLNEAYQYAYAETLARTEKTLRGPQHPNYYITMSGSGDVVLTEIRRSSSTLIISKPITGRVFLRDSRNSLVAELNKGAGRTVTLGLERGDYTVVNERNGRLYEARVTMAAGKRRTLNYSSFAVVDRESTRSRGEGTGDETGGGAAENRQDTGPDTAVQPRGFIDSIVRISLYGGGGLPDGGTIQKERHVFRAYKTDLMVSNLNPYNYAQYAIFATGGVELEYMPPAIKFAPKRAFDFTGIKFGIRGRYGYQEVMSVITPDYSNGFSSDPNNILMGRLMQYHYWTAGPVMNFIFSPRNNILNFMLSLYGMGGQVFNGNLNAMSSLRDSRNLAIYLAGAWSSAGLRPLMGWANLYTLSSLNKTRVRGYTIRCGFGPELSLNKYFPVVVGLHVTYAYTSLTYSRSPLIYMDGDRKAAHHEVGGELSLGVHF